ncbi:AAA family ATPase [Corynebacterium sp. LaCa116]|uniref:AAA family ATPase n=1 Tax=Corynebacterium sp. LaCa116 TaxID=3391423 RepID=UPI0039898F0E
MYLSKVAIESAVRNLRGTADHLLKIWFALKHMGLSQSQSVLVDTSNSTPSLQRLFHSGAPDGTFFIPFSEQKRFATMKNDAARSVIQTTIQRWNTSGSVVSVAPTEFLAMSTAEGGKIRVSCSRIYPQGLGHSKNGFATGDDSRVRLGLLDFAAWVFKQDFIPDDADAEVWLKDKLISELNLSQSEIEAIFVDSSLRIDLAPDPISDSELWEICQQVFTEKAKIEASFENRKEYLRRISSVSTFSSSPAWVNAEPAQQLRRAIEAGEKAVLLYGPPRTGKTRAIDLLYERSNVARETIQLHEGWGYSNLIMGLMPVAGTSTFEWREGVLLKALRSGVKVIVLEEINRTRVSQALGEVFSLIESQYRGVENAIKLPDGSDFYIDEDVTFFFTMNTIDTSTEAIDDALMGRIAAVYFPPRVEDLTAMLQERNVNQESSRAVREFFTFVQSFYLLGHGYFAGVRSEANFLDYYMFKIRPVLSNRFSLGKPEFIEQVDNFVDQRFA